MEEDYPLRRASDALFVVRRRARIARSRSPIALHGAKQGAISSIHPDGCTHSLARVDHPQLAHSLCLRESSRVASKLTGRPTGTVAGQVLADLSVSFCQTRTGLDSCRLD